MAHTLHCYRLTLTDNNVRYIMWVSQPQSTSTGTQKLCSEKVDRKLSETCQHHGAHDLLSLSVIGF